MSTGITLANKKRLRPAGAEKKERDQDQESCTSSWDISVVKSSRSPMADPGNVGRIEVTELLNNAPKGCWYSVNDLRANAGVYLI